MKIELNDETLTAYALGELTETEIEAVDRALAEAALDENDHWHETLDDIRKTVALSEAAFASEEAREGMRNEQRNDVMLLTHVLNTRRQFPWRAAVGLAAMLALIALLYTGTPRLMERETPTDSSAASWNDFLASAPDADRSTQNDARIENLRSNDAEFPQASSRGSGFGALSVSSTAAGSPRSSMGGELNNQPLPTQPQDQTAGSRSLTSGSLQSLEPTAGVQIRGNWFSEDEVRRAQSRSLSSQSNEDRERLYALGYIENDSSQSQSVANAPNRQQNVTFYADNNARPPLEATVEARAGRLPELNRAEPRKELSDQYAAGLRISRADVPDYRYYRPTPPPVASPGSEAYKPIVERGFTRVTDEPLSTFSIDVDTASYANVRRFLQQGQLPPPDAVRVEEMINYFDYAYGQPEGNVPFAAHFEMAACPWEPRHKLVRIGLKGREIPRAERPASNLVFLIDVSGSMQPANKLPLVRSAMSQLTRQLDERDTVSIVTYASGVNVALQPTNAGNQQTILNAINNLGAGGSTNGAGGIQMAYQLARQHYLPGGVNRVILATDGDFNVGLTDNSALERMIQAEASTGVFLNVYGYGMGNLKDDRLEMLADKGNGAYGYIDSETEARREFVEKLSGTLVTIAKDVKIQVEFNPVHVGAYRLVGYENRALAAQDFNDDRKDAGEIGAGHTVTALYEIVPAGQPIPATVGTVDALRYQTPQPAPQVEAARVAPETHPAHANELLLVKLRYKEPAGDTSKLLEFPLADTSETVESASSDFKFASAVAAFGKLLRGNPLGADLSYDGMIQLAQAGLTGSSDPHRAEMISLMLQARPMLDNQRFLDSTLQ